MRYRPFVLLASLNWVLKHLPYEQAPDTASTIKSTWFFISVEWEGTGVEDLEGK